MSEQQLEMKGYIPRTSKRNGALCGLLVCCSPVSIKTLCGSLLRKYEPQNIYCLMG